MKLINSLLTILMMSTTLFLQAQQNKDHLILGSIQSFKESLQQKVIAQKTLKKSNNNPILSVRVPSGKLLDLEIRFHEKLNEKLTLTGKVSGVENSNFSINSNEMMLTGHILLNDQKIAYTYATTANGSVSITKTDINEVLCIGLPRVSNEKSSQKTKKTTNSEAKAAVNNLQSNPGAATCIYLDYDGHYLPAGSRWNKGKPINAAPSGFSNSQIVESWEVVAEDFRPFNINVTTNKAVFDSYPYKKRMWCVFTPTNTAAPGAGGVAYMNSFGFIENEVCWVFQGGAKFSGEAASHELGHTLGLGHDGRTNPKEEYFAGHNSWAPIMGVGYGKPISQWSRGEYASSNNTQNDLSIMDQFIDFRKDDYGNNFSSATTLVSDQSGNIGQKNGVIERTSDKDMFSFNCGTGNVSIDIKTVNRHGNLDILATLYDGSGKSIGVFNGGSLNTKLDAYLHTGKYYISVDGTGSGNPATNGYSDYASLGTFQITGKIPPSVASTGNVTLYLDCPYSGFSAGLSEGSYTKAQLEALGMPNDKVSSLRVKPGYKATLYWDDNFKGASLVKTSDDSCLNNDGSWNDKMTSIIVSKTNDGGSSEVIEAENYASMSGVQKENCSEGGQNVGYIDTGDWMAYTNINFPTSGNYRIEYRVASLSEGGKLSADLNAGTTVLGALNIPSTGGWQNWTTISHTVNVNAGTHSFGIYAVSGGWNINWIKITEQNTARSFDSSLAQNAKLIKGVKEINTTRIYPNPFTKSIQFKFGKSHANVTIFDALGRIVMALKTIESGKSIDLSNLDKGLYMVTIEKEGIKETKRIIKE
ncbi:putative secreted protein (Por secretion system target) [Aquimarina sp. MAR_2010_214]|uniref:carbohydrate-binding protein n=1 Tax=Aquimarina sp. MAR_2010_214 TaxID=1250026 RepID=UPI000CAD5F1F|nr:carbohydrate-binding protein [Aquimarina sp. MAR_2010_214]PKV50190.1 putative secreted protein (Por secretion system target) [Aquimarina sp. MAR_2010_214]